MKNSTYRLVDASAIYKGSKSFTWGNGESVKPMVAVTIDSATPLLCISGQDAMIFHYEDSVQLPPDLELQQYLIEHCAVMARINAQEFAEAMDLQQASAVLNHRAELQL